MLAHADLPSHLRSAWMILLGALLALQPAFGEAAHLLIESLEEEDEELPWYVEANGAYQPSPWTVHLNGSQLSEEIARRQPTGHALITFYSPYCPHCQHFLPNLEWVALAINQSQLPVLVGKVDCTLYMKTCKQYLPSPNLPGVAWGSVENWTHPKGVEQITLIQDTAEELVPLLDEKLGSNLSLPNEQDFRDLWERLLAAGQSPAEEHNVKGHQHGAVANLRDIKLATALFVRSGLDQVEIYRHMAFPNHPQDQKRIDDARGALINFVHLLRDRFPNATCRSSFDRLGKLLQEHPKLKPEDMEKQWQMCDEPWDYFREGWAWCEPSWPGRRGFTCGLWGLMHTLSASEDANHNAMQGAEVMRTMLWWFFDCAECHEHFFRMNFTDADGASRSATQLWWWRAHNSVNQRLIKEEAGTLDGDPAFPKQVWPTEEMCPDCRGTSLQQLSFLSQLRRLRGGSDALQPSWTMPGADEVASGSESEPSLQESITGGSINDGSGAGRSWNLTAVTQFLRTYYHGN